MDADFRPPPRPGIVRITRKQAATGQLETAILLGFYERDSASIHTLAVAAQGILSAIAREMGYQSKTVSWINKQSKAFQEQLRNPQNFFKHGHHKQPFKDVVSYSPEMTEMLMIDAVSTYGDLFNSVTAVMSVFALRFSLKHPSALPIKETKAILAKHIKIESFAPLRRSEFFEKVYPLIIKRV